MYTVYTKGKHVLNSLANQRYISLTTFRSDGTQVSTPVWVVSDDGTRLLVWTGASTWKVRRIRRTPDVLVAASGFRGKERGPRHRGRARVIDDLDVESLIRRKYGWQKRLLDLVSRNSVPASWATIEIIDAA
jgi:uncharacterized protein